MATKRILSELSTNPQNPPSKHRKLISNGSHDQNGSEKEESKIMECEFVKDTIDKEWMKSKVSEFERTFGYNIACFSTDDWLPTPHGLTLAEAFKKSIEFQNLFTDKSVLELGAGVGNHTVLIMEQKPKHLTMTEISQTRMEVTRKTLEGNKFDCSVKNVSFLVCDWLHLHNDIKYDIIITNPPFAASGQRNRRYFIDELILNSYRHLKENGYLVFIQSSMADLEMSLTRLRQNTYDPKVCFKKKYYWRDYYFEEPSFLTESKAVRNGFEMDGDKMVESLYVIIAQLLPWKGSNIAH